MSKRILIVGGGAIGLATAWYCQQAGLSVTVIERNSAQRDGCSYGNAGLITPSHFVPLAAPGMIRLGLRMMWNPESPFYIRPRLSWELLSWLWKFKQACTAKKVQQAAPVLLELSLAGRQCYEELDQSWQGCLNIERAGLLMLCQTPHMLAEEIAIAKQAHGLGLPATILDPQGAAKLEPNIDMKIAGAIHYPQDAHLSPNALMKQLQDRLSAGGCEFLWNTEVVDFKRRGDTVHGVQTDQGVIAGDELVLCGGSWTASLAKRLGWHLPLQAGKGFSLTLPTPPQQPRTSAVLMEARVAVTPLGNALRFAGTMEMAGLDLSISQARLRGIIRSVQQVYPAFTAEDFSNVQPWAGLRPCTPDGLPYLGRTQRLKNVSLATGHAMMGISLALISGKVLADELMGEPNPLLESTLFSPDRYDAQSGR